MSEDIKKCLADCIEDLTDIYCHKKDYNNFEEELEWFVKFRAIYKYYEYITSLVENKKIEIYGEYKTLKRMLSSKYAKNIKKNEG